MYRSHWRYIFRRGGLEATLLFFGFGFDGVGDLWMACWGCYWGLAMVDSGTARNWGDELI